MNNVEWIKRDYDVQDFGSGNAVNQALSAANVCLYGLVYSIIVALGMSPGLGFIHTGHDLSFVYDVADLYKAEVTIPIAFQVAADIKPDDDIGRITRLKVRDSFVDGKILGRVVKDIQFLLGVENNDSIDVDTINLWDDKDKLVSYGVNYHEDK